MSDIRNIKKLVEIFENSSLCFFELSEGDFRLRLEKGVQNICAPAGPEREAACPAQTPAVQTVDFNNIKEVKSPMVGVFYGAAAPGEKPFVERGSRVKKGDVLCIIEAMKLFNEVTSDFDGEVADICVSDGQVVEFSQVLFKIF